MELKSKIPVHCSLLDLHNTPARENFDAMEREMADAAMDFNATSAKRGYYSELYRCCLIASPFQQVRVKKGSACFLLGAVGAALVFTKI